MRCRCLHTLVHAQRPSSPAIASPVCFSGISTKPRKYTVRSASIAVTPMHALPAAFVHLRGAGVGQQHETCACLQIEPHAGACRCPLQRLPVKVVREAIRSRQLRLLLLVDDVVIRWQVPLGKGFPVCKWKRLTGLGCVHHAAQAAHAATGTGTSARIGPS